MDTKVLEEIGLTQGEIKVYLALSELGSSTAGPILKKANIQNSVFHFCVKTLIDKGFVSYFKKGKMRIYTASDPKYFLTYIKDKEDDIKELLPELELKHSKNEEKNEVELFEGKKGIITLLNLLKEDAKKGDYFQFFPTVNESRNKEVQEFFQNYYDAKRKDKGLITRGIAPKSIKWIFKDRPYIKMKYTDFPLPGNYSVVNDKMALFSWGEKPVGVLIKAENLINRQREYFNDLWKAI